MVSKHVDFNSVALKLKFPLTEISKKKTRKSRVFCEKFLTSGDKQLEFYHLFA